MFMTTAVVTSAIFVVAGEVYRDLSLKRRMGALSDEFREFAVDCRGVLSKARTTELLAQERYRQRKLFHETFSKPMNQIGKLAARYPQFVGGLGPFLMGDYAQEAETESWQKQRLMPSPITKINFRSPNRGLSARALELRSLVTY
jgi:hypothetical protein